MVQIALIGGGNMGEAMLGSWLDSGVVTVDELTVCELRENRRKEIAERYGVKVVDKVRDAVSRAEMAVIAVKPQDSLVVLEEMSSLMGTSMCLLSVVAGVSIRAIRKRIGEKVCVVRVMPNLCARSRASISAFCIDPGLQTPCKEKILELLESFGDAVEVDEELMNLATAVSGSGPAYFFLLAEEIEKAAVSLGMPSEIAARLSRETLWGAGKVLKETGSNPAELRRAVSSPGGTTIAAIREFENGGLERLVARAVLAAMKRAEELEI